MADIQRRHGDHLYSKTDYDAAKAAYVETVGHVEPSYVIRRFLDVQRIHNLTLYLEALHQARQANSDHTTLLLNCYTKLKDIAKLDDFIRYGTPEASGIERDLIRPPSTSLFVPSPLSRLTSFLVLLLFCLSPP